MKKIAALISLLLLAGCDNRPTALQSMAQCKLDPRAGTAVWNDLFLQTCMEAKGYVRDDRRQIAPSFKCSNDVSAAEEPACYR